MEELELLNNTIHCVKMGAGQAVCEDCNIYECDHSVVEGLCRTALNALEKQLPKKPIHIHEEYPEHLWGRDKDGKVDLWAFEEGYCNGPVCTRCYHSECIHCNEDWETDPVCDCVVDKDICPACGSSIGKTKFCSKCGQALDWGE